MSNLVSEAGASKNFTSTTTIVASSTQLGTPSLLGIWVSSASNTPTLKVADSNRTIANTFTPAGATFYPIPAIWEGTLTITVGGTLDATAFTTTN